MEALNSQTRKTRRIGFMIWYLVGLSVIGFGFYANQTHEEMDYERIDNYLKDREAQDRYFSQALELINEINYLYDSAAVNLPDFYKTPTRFRQLKAELRAKQDDLFDIRQEVVLDTHKETLEAFYTASVNQEMYLDSYWEVLEQCEEELRKCKREIELEPSSPAQGCKGLGCIFGKKTEKDKKPKSKPRKVKKSKKK